MRQTIHYNVTIDTDAEGTARDKAQALADNITGWGCSAECKGSPVISVTVAAPDGTPLAWRNKGG